MLEQLATARNWIEESDRVLIMAGSGLSAAAGYDYQDPERFRQLFPALYGRGLRSRYMVGVPLPEPQRWGYWAVHIADIRFSQIPNPLYRKLHEIVAAKDYWVMTSNVDALFARNGFAPDRIYTPQGDYGRYQCAEPCSQETWDSEHLVRRLLKTYDPATGGIEDLEAVDRCPNCDGPIQINVRTGAEFVDAPYQQAGSRLERWLRTAQAGSRLLILELGAGFNTPGVVRWPSEHLTAGIAGTRLIRINPDHPDVPDFVADRAVGIPVGAARAVDSFSGFAAPRQEPAAERYP